jgi:hypothetical protein
MLYKTTMDYEFAYNTVFFEGWNGFKRMLNEKFKGLDLYFATIDWYYEDKFDCLVEGHNADLLISWEHRKNTKE